eukprot:scaffold15076_cov155-Amphora_coffeaeformis.AAC.4
MKPVTFHRCYATILVLGVLLDRSWGWMLLPASSSSSLATLLRAVPGADIEQPTVVVDDNNKGPVTADSTGGLATRGKKNEIDFTVAPADVSLSRAYGQPPPSSSGQLPATVAALDNSNENTQPVMSLTLALNNASNRAVRRIILARSWPSAEALNLSLRQVAEAERRAASAATINDNNAAKCPVPRPILNVLTRKRRYNSATTPGGVQRTPSPRKSRTDEEYVADQLQAFRQRYGSLPTYEQAEDYLAAVLSLATSGVESPRAPLDAGHAYQDSYRRLLGVLRTVGVVFEDNKQTSRRFISQQLNDNDICLSMLDRIQMERAHSTSVAVEPSSGAVDTKSDEDLKSVEEKEQKKAVNDKQQKLEKEEAGYEVDAEGATVLKPRIRLFGGNKENSNKKPSEKAPDSNKKQPENAKDQNGLTNDDLGGVLLSAKEPSMTRQLNVLSNIVLRALLFGGDQELLVLAETLDADRAAFVERWYPATGGLLNDGDLKKEDRPGVQYLNCLIDLLRECYDDGIVVDLQPSLPLSQSYANAYERLVAMALELGSGYLKPVPASSLALPKPRTAKEELGRLALWESRFRQKASTTDISPYPEDLEGVWEVRDVIGGETIGTTRVTLGSEGEVIVNPPMEGLRWRLDPGPTHLDTCTFQVLNTDGTILQYRGFIDRGARLEARFSKRAMRIRGSVMFQMRDGSVDYYKDILPINYREGTTKFVMTKVV